MSFDISPYRELYPFQGKYFDLRGMKMHYLDEGEGAPILCVHGNPSWSIYYRAVLEKFSSSHRCIVPDHLGCGLSDKPGDGDYDFLYQSRVDDLEALLDFLGIRSQLTLVLHDWGGAIGLGYAARHPERVERLVLSNTAAFFKPPGKSLPWQLYLARNTPLGSLLVLLFNAFAWGATKTCVAKRKMSPLLQRAYCAPYDSWHNRKATLRFVQDIPLEEGDPSYRALEQTEQALENFRETPCLVLWGEKDYVFDTSFLEEWKKRLPKAQFHSFPDCGHYLLEDAPDEALALMEEFFEANPIEEPKE